MEFDYKTALYRRNNSGAPCVWYVETNAKTWYNIFYGIVGKTITRTTITSSRDAFAEAQSKFNEKRKQGYKFLNELKDNTTLPVEGELLTYLNAYLPYHRTAADGTFLPMLAKTYDNENNKLFKKTNSYYGQWKINGLRCEARPCIRNGGLFKEKGFRFTSREGIEWQLPYLEEYLMSIIPEDVFTRMIDEEKAFDGEVYLPGYTVNQINHFVKDKSCSENKDIQFWCYDIIASECTQKARFDFLGEYFNNYCVDFKLRTDHLNNTNRFVILPLYMIYDDHDAINKRDRFIDLGFEGLIMRNPSAEYQFGARNSSMIKYKKSIDGKFFIVNVKPEGIKRPDIPLFVCKNDINESLFECHCGGSLDYQRSLLIRKNDIINKKFMYVEYGERSGVEQLPFHVKTTYIIDYK